MNIFDSKTPAWPIDADKSPVPEDREGLNIHICEHGWHRATCGKCKPVKLKKKKDVQKMS
jgi:hypothetical protein